MSDSSRSKNQHPLSTTRSIKAHYELPLVQSMSDHLDDQIVQTRSLVSEIDALSPKQILSTSRQLLLNKAESILVEQQIYRGSMFKLAKEHKLSLSPIMRLPDKVLGQIFICSVITCEICAGRRNSSEDRRTRVSTLMPSQVCSHWRSVALSTPELWSHINFVIPFSAKDARSEETAMKTFIARSKDSPLSIIMESDSPSSKVEAELSRIRRCILPSIARWREADLTITRSAFDALRAVKRAPLSLETLSLRRGNHTIIPEHTSLGTFAVAPKLRRLHLMCFSPNWLQISWIQLTDLTWFGGFSNYDQAMDLLRQCSNLECCRLWVEPNFRRSMAQQHLPIRLPHLRQFEIAADGSCLEGFLQVLVLPTLRDLSVAVFLELDVSQIIQSLIERSSCHLEVLEISSPILGSEIHFLDICRASPRLVHLSVDLMNRNTGISSQVMNHLVLTPSVPKARQEQYLLPALRTIKLNLPLASDSAFLQMILSRWRPSHNPAPQQLAKLELIRLVNLPEGWKARNTALLSSLQELERCGLNIQVYRHLNGDGVSLSKWDWRN